MTRRTPLTLGALVIALGAVCFGITREAQATMMLTLEDLNQAGSKQTLTDTTGTGLLTFNGAIGHFGVNVTTGISKPLIGPNQLHLNSINVSGAGHIEILLTDTDFSSLTPATLLAEFGGVKPTNGTVEVWQYADFSNQAFAPGCADPTCVAMHRLLSGAPQAFAETQAVGLGSHTGTFSLTERVQILHTSAGSVTSLDLQGRVTPVPEPNMSLLLGVGLCGVVGGVKFFRWHRMA
jgi:hypothetical protein